MTAIIIFFVAHWYLSLFCQTFFLHRYSSHRMFTLSPINEKFFYFMTLITQGPGYLRPSTYGKLHRSHHQHSDTKKDPHSPVFFKSPWSMMVNTKRTYAAIADLEDKNPETKDVRWDIIDHFGDSWFSRILFGSAYTLFYVIFAPSWVYFLLLPVHFLMGPIQGAVVNWCGHRYGRQNFDNKDQSRNCLIWDIFLLGELFQNNHHHNGQRANFGYRWFEFDPVYPIIKIFHFLKIIQLKDPNLNSPVLNDSLNENLESKKAIA